MTNREAYATWQREYPNLVRAILALLRAGQTPQDVLVAMSNYGAPERMLTISRMAFLHIIETERATGGVRTGSYY